MRAAESASDVEQLDSRAQRMGLEDNVISMKESEEDENGDEEGERSDREEDESEGEDEDEDEERSDASEEDDDDKDVENGSDEDEEDSAGKKEEEEDEDDEDEDERAVSELEDDEDDSGEDKSNNDASEGDEDDDKTYDDEDEDDGTADKDKDDEEDDDTTDNDKDDEEEDEEEEEDSAQYTDTDDNKNSKEGILGSFLSMFSSSEEETRRNKDKKYNGDPDAMDADSAESDEEAGDDDEASDESGSDDAKEAPIVTIESPQIVNLAGKEQPIHNLGTAFDGIDNQDYKDNEDSNPAGVAGGIKIETTPGGMQGAQNPGNVPASQGLLGKMQPQSQGGDGSSQSQSQAFQINDQQQQQKELQLQQQQYQQLLRTNPAAAQQYLARIQQKNQEQKQSMLQPQQLQQQQMQPGGQKDSDTIDLKEIISPEAYTLLMAKHFDPATLPQTSGIIQQFLNHAGYPKDAEALAASLTNDLSPGDQEHNSDSNRLSSDQVQNQTLPQGQASMGTQPQQQVQLPQRLTGQAAVSWQQTVGTQTLKNDHIQGKQPDAALQGISQGGGQLQQQAAQRPQGLPQQQQPQLMHQQQSNLQSQLPPLQGSLPRSQVQATRQGAQLQKSSPQGADFDLSQENQQVGQAQIIQQGNPPQLAPVENQPSSQQLQQQREARSFATARSLKSDNAVELFEILKGTDNKFEDSTNKNNDEFDDDSVDGTLGDEDKDSEGKDVEDDDDDEEKDIDQGNRGNKDTKEDSDEDEDGDYEGEDISTNKSVDRKENKDKVGDLKLNKKKNKIIGNNENQEANQTDDGNEDEDEDEDDEEYDEENDGDNAVEKGKDDEQYDEENGEDEKDSENNEGDEYEEDEDDSGELENYSADSDQNMTTNANEVKSDTESDTNNNTNSDDPLPTKTVDKSNQSNIKEDPFDPSKFVTPYDGSVYDNPRPLNAEEYALFRTIPFSGTTPPIFSEQQVSVSKEGIEQAKEVIVSGQDIQKSEEGEVKEVPIALGNGGSGKVENGVLDLPFQRADYSTGYIGIEAVQLAAEPSIFGGFGPINGLGSNSIEPAQDVKTVDLMNMLLSRTIPAGMMDSPDRNDKSKSVFHYSNSGNGLQGPLGSEEKIVIEASPMGYRDTTVGSDSSDNASDQYSDYTMESGNASNDTEDESYDEDYESESTSEDYEYEIENQDSMNQTALYNYDYDYDSEDRENPNDEAVDDVNSSSDFNKSLSADDSYNVSIDLPPAPEPPVDPGKLCPREVKLAKTSHPVTALVMFPGTATEWVKEILQQLTGKLSLIGSVHP